MSTFTWKGGSGDYADPANWTVVVDGVEQTATTPPGASDIAIVTPDAVLSGVGAAGTLTAEGALTVAGTLTDGSTMLDGSLTVSGTLAAGSLSDMASAETITVSGSLSAGQIGNIAPVTLVVTGTTAQVSAPIDIGFGGTGSVSLSDGATIFGELTVGGTTTEAGTGTIGNGVTLNGRLVVGTMGGQGSVAIDGSTVGLPDGFAVGLNGGTGTLTLTGVVVATQGTDEVGLGGTGTLDINAGTILTATLDVGDDDGTGTVTIANGGAIIGTATLGTGPTGSGSLTIDGGGTLNGAVVLGLGGGGTGVLTVDNGGTLQGSATVGTTEFGVSPGGSGTLTVDAGGILTGNGTVTIGTGGGASGTVAASGTATVYDATTVIGPNGGGGTLTLGDGIQAQGGLDIESGSATIDGGASLTQTAGGNVVLGDGQGAAGALTVDGTKSALVTPMVIDVGMAGGSGTLTVSGGAGVTANNTMTPLAVGAGSGSSGTVTVTGMGSMLSTKSASGLFTTIGSSHGSGVLAIKAGATATIGGAVNVGDPSTGAVGTISVDGMGSSFTANEVYVGYGISAPSAGTSKLTVSNGATATLGSLGEGIFGGTGTVGSTVVEATGQGSLLKVAGQLNPEGPNDLVEANQGGVILAGSTAENLNGGTFEAQSGGQIVLGGATAVADAPGAVVVPQGAFADGSGGVIDGDLDVGGLVQADTLTVTGNTFGAGTLSMVGLSGDDITLDGTVANGTTISFGYNQPAGGTLTLEEPGGFAGTVMNFAAGQTIDLVGVSANAVAYDRTTGILTVKAQASDPAAAALATIKLADTNPEAFNFQQPGDQYPGSDELVTDLENPNDDYFGVPFLVSPDGNGGTDITIDPTPLPTYELLAQAANDVYETGAPAAIGSYAPIATMSDDDGFYAVAYQSGHQIIVAYRGTVSSLSDIYDTALNLLQDTSWVSGNPNPNLQIEVREASQFLYTLQSNPLYAGDTFTLTGHSLGGGLAQMVGYASGDRAIGFNAPKGGNFIAPLELSDATGGPPLADAELLAPAAGSGQGVSGVNIDLRMIGDLVSLIGNPTGPVYSFNSNYSDSVFNILSNHLMGQFITQLAGTAEPFYQTGIVEYISTLTDAADLGMGLDYVGQIATKPVSFVVQSAVQLLFDPPSFDTFELDGDAGSPDFASIVLPSTDGVDHYELGEQIDGTYATPSLVEPGATTTLPAGVTGIKFWAEDASDNVVTLDGSFIFGASFASSGTFNGTLTETISCFREGTRIAMRDGAREVEHIRVGDRVRTARGELRPVVWVGRWHIDCARLARPEDAWPVCVRAGAFGAGAPARDLFLSRDHAVWFDGVLIPVRYLIDGAMIRQEAVAAVTYWHIELDPHDVVLAEGLAVESYLDDGGRGDVGGAGVMRLRPAFHDPSRGDLRLERSCAPLTVTGDAVARARRLVAMHGEAAAVRAAMSGYSAGGMVPRGGIEPPTLRFSVACSTN